MMSAEPSDEAVERAAEAGWRAFLSNAAVTWDEKTEPARDLWRDVARAVLTAAADTTCATCGGDGWVNRCGVIVGIDVGCCVMTSGHAGDHLSERESEGYRTARCPACHGQEHRGEEVLRNKVWHLKGTAKSGPIIESICAYTDPSTCRVVERCQHCGRPGQRLTLAEVVAIPGITLEGDHFRYEWPPADVPSTAP